MPKLGRRGAILALLAGTLLPVGSHAVGPFHRPQTVDLPLAGGMQSAGLYVRTGGPYLRQTTGLAIDARDAAVVGKLAFVAAGTDGFVVLSLRDGTAQTLARLPVGKLALGIELLSNTAWVFGSAGLTAIDVTDPSQPRLLGQYSTPSAPLGLALEDGHGFLLLERELDILDLQAPEPRLLSRIRLGVNGRAITAKGNEVYIAAGRAGIVRIDASRPESPVLADRFGSDFAALDIARSQDRLYVAAGDSGIKVFDLSNPAAQPHWLGSLQVGKSFDRLAVADDHALGRSSNGTLYLLDVANPAAMSIAARLMDGCCTAFKLNGAEASSLAGGHLMSFDIGPLRPRLGNEGLAFGQGVNLGGQRRIAIAGETAYVADWFSGLHIYDIRQPRRPRLIANLHTAGSSKGVVVRDGFAYVADDDHGLQIVDVHDRRHPRRVAGIETPGLAYTPVLDGNRLYLALHHGGMAIVDISNPLAPMLISHTDLPGKAWSLRVRNGLAYVAADDAGLLVIDVSDARAPSIIGRFEPGGHAEEVVLEGDTAYVALFEGSVRMLNIHDPSAPVEIGHWETAGNARGLVLRDKILYIADWLAGIEMIDVSHAARPVLLGRYDTDGAAWGLALLDDFAMVADWWGGISILDLHSRQSPALAGVYPRRRPIEQAAASGRFLYTVQGDGGLQIFDVQNPLNPTWAAGIDIPAAHQVAVSGDRLYVGHESGRIAVIDIGNAFQPEAIGEIRVTHPLRWLRVDDGELLAVGRREATLIDTRHGDQQRRSWPDDVTDAWLDHGRAFIVTAGGVLESMAVGETGFGEPVTEKTGGKPGFVRATENRVFVALAEGDIVVLSRDTAAQELGRISPGSPVDDIETDGETLYVAQGRSLTAYDVSTPPPWRIRSKADLLDPIRGIALGDEALYLAGGPSPVAIDPLPDFGISLTDGTAHIDVPPGAPAGDYDLLSEGGAQARSAIVVAPLHFGKRAK